VEGGPPAGHRVDMREAARKLRLGEPSGTGDDMGEDGGGAALQAGDELGLPASGSGGDQHAPRSERGARLSTRWRSASRRWRGVVAEAHGRPPTMPLAGSAVLCGVRARRRLTFASRSAGDGAPSAWLPPPSASRSMGDRPATRAVPPGYYDAGTGAHRGRARARALGRSGFLAAPPNADRRRRLLGLGAGRTRLARLRLLDDGSVGVGPRRRVASSAIAEDPQYPLPRNFPTSGEPTRTAEDEQPRPPGSRFSSGMPRPNMGSIRSPLRTGVNRARGRGVARSQ
jgi:hypothetical protein